MPHLQFDAVFRHIRRLVGADTLPERSDSQLLNRFSTSHDEDAFAALLQRHGPLVLNVCRRILGNDHDADDAFQATFLVLARKAGSIRRAESLARWLYGVAYRIASKSKTAVAQRTVHERRAVDMTTGPSDTALWEELRPLLDEELSRIPEKYRVAIVLRYLQGLSTEEAAREAGCPAGTMKWRLAQALEMLRQRLARRGATIPASGLAVVLAENGTSAAMPAALAEGTLKAALVFAAPATVTAGAISLSITAMAEGMLRTMWISKLATTALVVVVLVLTGTGLSVLAFQTLGHEVTVVLPPENPPQSAAREPDAGKPVNGLQLTLSADKTETVMTADGSNAEPVKLKLTFTNVSDKPIKLEISIGAYKKDVLFTEQLQLLCSGSLQPRKWIGVPASARPDLWKFPVIMAKESTSFELPLPGSIGDRYCSLSQPGVYRLRVSYSTTKYDGQPISKDSWNGTLTSNELVLAVKPAGGADAGKPVREPPDKEPRGTQPAERPQSDPPGVPLELRLVGEKASYPLDLGGKTKKFYQGLKGADDFGRYPAPQIAGLVIEIINTSKDEIQFLSGGWGGWPPKWEFSLAGPGAVSVRFSPNLPDAVIPPKKIKLGPGETFKLEVASFYGTQASDHSTNHNLVYWYEPGDYTLKVRFETAISPVPKGSTVARQGFGNVTLTSAVVNMKVTER